MKDMKCPMCGKVLRLTMNGWIDHRLSAFNVHFPHKMSRSIAR